MRVLCGVLVAVYVLPLCAQESLVRLLGVNNAGEGGLPAVAVAAPAPLEFGPGATLDMNSIPADSLAGLSNSGAESLPQQTEFVEQMGLDEGLARDLNFCDDDDGDGVCNSNDYCANTPTQAVVLPSGCHLTRDAPLELVGVFFDFNGNQLRPESYEILDRVVAVLKQQFQVIVEVGGHTDSRGDKAANQIVSEKRAKAVYDYFVSQGIAAYRLRYRGYGESQPVAPNSLPGGRDNPEGRARNRRVDLRVISDLTDLNTDG